MAQIIAIDLYSLSQPVKSKQHFPNSIKSLNYAGFFLNLQQPNIVGFFAFAYLLYIYCMYEKKDDKIFANHNQLCTSIGSEVSLT